MKVIEVTHPLVQHKLGMMRKVGIGTKDFRHLGLSGVIAFLFFRRYPFVLAFQLAAK